MRSLSVRASADADADAGAGGPIRRLLCLDFDGVVCDTAGESAVAALRCLKSPAFSQASPDESSSQENVTTAAVMIEEVEEGYAKVREQVGICMKEGESVDSWLVRNVKDARPAVTTGYENVLMMMMLLKSLKDQVHVALNGSVGDYSIERTLPSSGIELMKEWGVEGSGGLCDLALEGAGAGDGHNNGTFTFNNGLSREELVILFGRTRDDMIFDDQQAWINANSLYEGIGEALKHFFTATTGSGPHPSVVTDLWIVTTKQERFARLLLSSLAGIEIESGRCVSVTASGRPKSEVLFEISNGIVPKEVSESGNEGSIEQEIDGSCTSYDEKIFVEDRLGALERVINDSRLDDWRLVLVDYGYNTADERTKANKSERMELMTLLQFCDLLKGS